MLFIVEEHSLLYGSDDKVVFHVSVTSVGPRNAMTQACGMKVLAGGRPFLYGSNELVEVHPDFLWAACDGAPPVWQTGIVTRVPDSPEQGFERRKHATMGRRLRLLAN
jgi:hypothetical protein